MTKIRKSEITELIYKKKIFGILDLKKYKNITNLKCSYNFYYINRKFI